MKPGTVYTMAALLLTVLAVLEGSAGYKQVANYSGASFFSGWQFFSGDDPTHGYVDYTTQQQAQDWNLINTNNDKVFIGCDTTTVSSGRGRASVRITTNITFTTGLFVIDLDHMPTGCGTWPAFWAVGPNWPGGGEIDVIEGVNVGTQDQTTLHTSAGCSMDGQDPNGFNGKFLSTNCEGNVGCGILENGADYGGSLNSEGGGVYAAQWTNDVIQAWFWKHGAVPGDLTSGNPNPAGWGKPYAKFGLGNNCPASHFSDMSIIINLTFCGDWAGSVFEQQCPGKGSCQDYVQNNPAAFKEAYWSINYVALFE